jgi:hypothetical protein
MERKDDAIRELTATVEGYEQQLMAFANPSAHSEAEENSHGKAEGGTDNPKGGEVVGQLGIFGKLRKLQTENTELRKQVAAFGDPNPTHSNDDTNGDTNGDKLMASLK